MTEPRDRGWGQSKGPGPNEERPVIPDPRLELAEHLAQAVRQWEWSPTMNNQWAMLDACAQYEAAR